MPRTSSLALRALVALVLVSTLASRPAMASSVSAYLEPGYSNEHTEIRDSLGRVTVIDRQAFLQNYRLGLDLDLWQNLLFSASGTFLNTSFWSVINEVNSRFEQPTLGLVARLTYSTPVLTLGAQWDMNEKWATGYSTLMTQGLGAYANWRPLELPQIDLQFSRNHAYDLAGVIQDTTTYYGIAGIRYTYGPLDARYNLIWGEGQDAKTEVTSSFLEQVVQGTYNDTFLNQRVAAYATAALLSRTQTVTATGPGGTVARQQFPLAGLSLVEIFPSTPTNSTLAPNPALIDGNTTGSAGINIGFAPATAGDQNFRDMGVQFADELTPVNAFYLWVDKALPSEVVSVLGPAFTVYSSRDNANWVQVPIVGPVVFGIFQNRFEINFEKTTARYLKVVTRPIPPGVTSDRAYADVFVTELQSYLVVPADSVPTKISTLGAIVNATVKAAILRVPNLDYDFSIYYNRQSNPGISAYTLVNGLTFSSRLWASWTFNARVARQDSDPGGGHESQWMWTAALAVRPIPTLYAALTYSGTQNTLLDHSTEPPTPASTIGHALSLFGRADLYEGVSLQANVTGSTNLDIDLRASNVGSGSVTLALVPNPLVALNATYTNSTTWLSGGFLPDDIIRSQRVYATLIATPFPSLSASAQVTWMILPQHVSTLASFQVNFSPLRGDLQLSFAYTRTLNTAGDSIAQYISPSMRWNLLRGVFLNASYNLNDTSSPIGSTSSRIFATTLLIIL
jgi:hypothetical protein